MSIETMLAVALIGAFVGFLGGVFGKGGSAIATPLLALVGIPATAVGAYATRWIGGDALVTATEVVVTGLGIRFLLRPGDPHEIAAEPTDYLRRMILVAAGVGLLSGLLANAGGFLLAPLFVVVLRLSIKQSFATSLAVAAVLAVPGTIVHAALGHIDWEVVAIFGATSIPLSFLGARTALRTNPVHLERAYGAGLALLGATLLISGLL